MSKTDAAVAAIKFALKADDSQMEFLRVWYEGRFDAIRREWPEAPEEVFVGADPSVTPLDEIRSLEDDAARYRWLRNNCQTELKKEEWEPRFTPALVIPDNFATDNCFENIDAFVDQQIKAHSR